MSAILPRDVQIKTWQRVSANDEMPARFDARRFFTWLWMDG
jgi:hypothetical protein